MQAEPITFSEDQAEAFDHIAEQLAQAGIDIAQERLVPEAAGKGAGAGIVAITGRAGSGKTMLLARLAEAVLAAGAEIVTGDREGASREKVRSLAIMAPTNKAASVLRAAGVPATTIHRILYTPLYDPEYEKVADWLARGGKGELPEIEGLSEEALRRALAQYELTRSVPAALAAAGLRGSDFITGWKRRESPLDIGFVDEASMLEPRQLEDLKEIFPSLVLFGDPAQLAPVNASGGMVFDELPAPRILKLERIHRQARGNPILDLAHALGDPDLEFPAFEEMIRQAARSDERVRLSERADCDLMARSPVLVWRNATRVRLIRAFRRAHGASDEALLPGEPLICDGLELPMKQRHKRIDLEARGLIKGAQAIYLGPGRKPGFSRLHLIGAEQPQISVASIIKIESPDEDEPFIPYAARMGAAFLHGAAVTIHKAQGSQWENVQIFAPDIWAASRSGRSEAGIALWKRLAYVGITRASARLIWVTRNRLARPTRPLGTDDLKAPAAEMQLESPPGASPPGASTSGAPLDSPAESRASSPKLL